MTQQTRRFLRFKQVKEIVGLGSTCIYEKIAKGEFPKPISLGARAVAWESDSIEQWMTDRIEASRHATSTQSTPPRVQEVVP